MDVSDQDFTAEESLWGRRNEPCPQPKAHPYHGFNRLDQVGLPSGYPLLDFGYGGVRILDALAALAIALLRHYLPISFS